MIYPPRNMNQHIRKNECQGSATEAAIVFGTDPVIGLTAVSPFPYGVDELAAAGAIRGEPVDVVRCLTVDLEVPATAEIVVEGKIPFQGREQEGPFGEYAGYMGEGGIHPVFEISCITHRHNPIYQAFLSQMPPSESSCIKSFGREMEIRRHLKNNLGLPVHDVCVTESSGATAILLISMRKQNRFQPLKAMMGAWSLAIGVGKITIVVDEDIDIREPFQVEWALSFRMQPAEDIHIVRNTDPMALDPSQPQKDGKKLAASEQVSSKVGIDATRKFPYPPPAAPPKEHLERVAANWRNTEFKKCISLEQISLVTNAAEYNGPRKSSSAGKCVYPIVGRYENTPIDHNGALEILHAAHLLILTAACKQDLASFAVKSMQPVAGSSTNRPYNWLRTPVDGSRNRRSSAHVVRAPGDGH
jgi:4-hydroxy-3-polyprenylbenzoate decarboxylase